MARWDDDEFWDDSEEPPQQVPVVEELEGSVYMVADRHWGFRAEGREHHPGACVRCDLAARLTFLNKGTDLGSARPDRFLHVNVEPSPQNGLSKPTAFALDPRRVRLHVLRCLHQGEGLLGRLEDAPYQIMRRHFDGLAHLLRRNQP